MIFGDVWATRRTKSLYHSQGLWVNPGVDNLFPVGHRMQQIDFVARVRESQVKILIIAYDS